MSSLLRRCHGELLHLGRCQLPCGPLLLQGMSERQVSISTSARLGKRVIPPSTSRANPQSASNSSARRRLKSWPMAARGCRLHNIIRRTRVLSATPANAQPRTYTTRALHKGTTRQGKTRQAKTRHVGRTSDLEPNFEPNDYANNNHKLFVGLGSRSTYVSSLLVPIQPDDQHDRRCRRTFANV